MKHTDLLFRLGYLLTTEEVGSVDDPFVHEVSERWTRDRVGSFLLYHDPELPVYRYGEGTSCAVLLGLAIDPVTGINDPLKIIESLFRCHARSEEEFLERLDDLTGRFVIILQSGAKCTVFQDASGLKTVFYDASDSYPAISSHASLLARLRRYDISSDARQLLASQDYFRTISYFPGNATPYERVRMLTPNTSLDLTTGHVKRFFPRGPVGSRQLDGDLVKELSGFLKREVELLSENHSLALSLTGGTDSRLSASATVGRQLDVHYFTWVCNEQHQREVAIAGAVCDLLGGQHTVYQINEETCGDDLADYMEIWELNVAGMRARSQGLISKVLLDSYPSGYLHLKSTVSEIGRAFYRRNSRSFLPRRISPEALAHCYSIDKGSRFVQDEFRRYIDTVQFTPETLFDYDLYDIFYWEHRSGVWQSLQVMDFDTSHDTFVLYNNRRWLTKVLALPMKDRLNDRHLRAAIVDLWPDGFDVPLLAELKPWHQRVTKENVRKVKYWLEDLGDDIRRKNATRLGQR